MKRVEFPTHDRPSTDINMMTVVGTGALITLGLMGLIYFLPPTFLRDLIMGRGDEKEIIEHHRAIKVIWERVIFQGLTLFMWALSTANVFFKIQRLKKERAALASLELPERLDFNDDDQLVAAYEKVRTNPNFTTSLAVTRVARVLSMWINSRNFERTAQYSKEENELDIFAADSSFRANRLYIWAMPLLGFVGTVYGVSAGVSGFEAFLNQTGAVTPEAMKQQVGNITAGLAVAFYCTLLGLVTAGMAAFPSLFAERKEEAVLGELEEFVEDKLISQMPSTQTEVAQMKFPIEEMAKAIDQGFSRLPNPDKYEEVFSVAISKAGDIIGQKYNEFAGNYEKRINELGSGLGTKLESVGSAFSGGTQRLMSQVNDQTQRIGQTLVELESRQVQRLDAIVQEMKDLTARLPEDLRKGQERSIELQSKNEQRTAERFEELTEEIVTKGKEQAEQFADAHERYLDAIKQLDQKEIARWEKMVNDFNQLSVRLAEQFKQSVASLDSASGRYSERIQASTQSLADQLGAVAELGANIDKVLRTTQAMDTTMRQMGSSDEFRQTLTNLRNHLVASDELLKQLSKPRKVVFSEARSGDE